MRLALTIAALAALCVCSACSGDKTTKAAPERRSAAGEVLGGEVSDAMLPLDTARSTSPAGRSGPTAEDQEGDGGESKRRAPAAARAAGPMPGATGGPEPAPVAPAGVEPVGRPSPP